MNPDKDAKIKLPRPTIQVNIILHGILRDSLPRQAKGRATLTLPEATTITDIIARLNIKQTVSAVVNGTEVEHNHPLQNGDELHLFRLIAGG